MFIDSESFDLAQLSERAGVSTRTVRYYIQQGLLPSPEARGPGAHYGLSHLDRLRLIRRMQREHLPLAEIRRRLESMSPADIRCTLERGGDGIRGDASEYIRGVLGSPSDGDLVPSAGTMAAQAPAPMSFRAPEQSPAKETTSTGRSQWDRVHLAADVELHVRRPLSREFNRLVERLLDAARNIFEDNAP